MPTHKWQEGKCKKCGTKQGEEKQDFCLKPYRAGNNFCWDCEHYRQQKCLINKTNPKTECNSYVFGPEGL